MVDLTTRIASVELPNPVLTASGTAGHGAELAAYFPLSGLGAIVVKSLSADPWPGNPSPRMHPAPAGMLNSVGLQGPGVSAWLDHDLPELVDSGARVVVSVWGRAIEEFAIAAKALAGAPAAVVALEINLSCPNLAHGRLFAQSPGDAAEVIDAVRRSVDRPVWAKLTAATADVVSVAAAVRDAGADAVTCINTLPAMAIDPATGRYRHGAGPGGSALSGPALHPVAVRVVHDVARACPGLPIIGVGGVVDAASAIELLRAGACAVQVGTATFADPRAPMRILRDLEDWCRRHDVAAVTDLIGDCHD